jgi:hypothetical protein
MGADLRKCAMVFSCVSYYLYWLINKYMSYREQILKLNKLKKYDKNSWLYLPRPQQLNMIKIWNEWSMYNFCYVHCSFISLVPNPSCVNWENVFIFNWKSNPDSFGAVSQKVDTSYSRIFFYNLHTNNITYCQGSSKA